MLRLGAGGMSSVPCLLGPGSCSHRSLSRCPVRELEPQAACGWGVQMWLSAAESKGLISVAFEVSCLGHASISFPAQEKM